MVLIERRQIGRNTVFKKVEHEFAEGHPAPGGRRRNLHLPYQIRLLRIGRKPPQGRVGHDGSPYCWLVIQPGTVPPTTERVFENRQVRASRLVMVVIMARWTVAWWWSGLVS